MANLAKKQFYRRTLPSTCIAFGSEEGKQIFKEAMNGNHMSCYFNLAAQFRTQDEPAYCGLSTLVMVLNALSVDPGRVWKGPWRWYHENMLDCCVPLTEIEKHGITLFHFSCLAKCNGLDVDMVQAIESATVEDFRNDVKRITEREDKVMVCSYSRKILEQTGDGHFSPIGGYHADRDMVLIFDVARFKYPPHWIQVEMLWKAMQGLDKETEQPRGYLMLKRTDYTGIPTVLFGISKQFNLSLSSQWNPKILSLIQDWWKWLGTICGADYEKAEYFEIFVTKFLDLWCTNSFSDGDQLLVMKIDEKCCELSELHQCAICDLIVSLEKQSLFHIVENSSRCDDYKIADCCYTLARVPQGNKQVYCRKKQNASDSKLPEMKPAHFATIILLSWPYEAVSVENSTEMTHACLSSKYIGQEITAADQILQSEVELLKNQFATIFSYARAMDGLASL